MVVKYCSTRLENAGARLAMNENDKQLIQRLREENPRFCKLHDEHLAFEKGLERFQQKRFLTPEEEVEKKKLQKLKLAGKDEMEKILRKTRS